MLRVIKSHFMVKIYSGQSVGLNASLSQEEHVKNRCQGRRRSAWQSHDRAVASFGRGSSCAIL